MSRVDLDGDNEATGFMIASKGLCGGDYSEVDSDDDAWLAAVREGVFLPFALVQDDGFVIRVVLDEPLTPQEQDEWVGRSRHRLRVPDGRLAVIGGGAEYLWGEDVDEFTRFLDVPPGDYLAEVYTYLQGVNGPYCLSSADPDEPLGAYFRRTRPGVPFPLWLHNLCADDPELDPGHESDWLRAASDYEADQPTYVSFLLRLSPLREPPETPPLEDGWFPEDLGARKPAAFPLGLPADRLGLDGEG
jgi:hypothetical protein